MPLYSSRYIEELKLLHARTDRPRGFGGKVKPLGAFYSFLDKWQPDTVIDYGCGKGAILNHLQINYPKITWHGYDPAVSQFRNIELKKYDCLFSNDVLEHIEPHCLDSVLDHMWQLTEKFLWLRIDTKPARKSLTDGRNAHLILEDKDWWLEKLSQYPGKLIYAELGKKGKLDVAIEK